MNRASILLIAALLPITELAAQSDAPMSDGSSVAAAYRRTPQLRNDPFRHLMVPHWGFVMSVGVTAENNALLMSDLGDLLVSDRSNEVIGDVVTTLGAVPPGAALQGAGQGEAGIFFGGPVHRLFQIGFSAQARGYGSFVADEDAIVLLRDGLGGTQDFFLGSSGGSGIATSEYGVHGLVRLGPLGSEDGVQLSFGFGGRYVRPLAYARAQTSIDSRLAIVGDSIAARLDIENLATPSPGLSVNGSGVVGDFLFRAEWPTSGFAFEAMVANVGRVTLGEVERRLLSFSVNTTNLLEVNDSLETLAFQIQDTVATQITLPRIVRFAASAWASRYVQLDGSATLPVDGEFETPFVVDVGSTWRPVAVFPIRLGLILGGHQGIGYTAGLGIESRHFLFTLAGGSLGGFASDATGLGGRFDMGFFF